jgi:NAD(P)-dependent dehydrogenase (short-subunit alcohol dehydrogenase family)
MPNYQTTEDGIEKQLAVNHLSSFIFCHLLLPLFKNSKGCRLVFVSSHVYKLADTNTKMILGKRKFYHPTLAYAETKLLNLIFANHLAQCLRDEKIEILNVHPGTLKTDIGNKHATFLQARIWDMMKLFGRSASRAASDIIALLDRNDTINHPSCIWYNGKPYALEGKITDAENINRVMELSCQLAPCLPINSSISAMRHSSRPAEDHISS